MADRKARYERRQKARERRHQESRGMSRRNLIRILLTATGGLVVIALVIGGIVVYGGTQKLLPPTSFGPGHSEAFPPQQINTQPIPLPIQEHVMEHAPTVPGILVQYNCQDYQCEPDLVQKLTEIVQSYPPRVFLAPFPGMDAKIALAAPGDLEILEAVEEERIRQFIERHL